MAKVPIDSDENVEQPPPNSADAPLPDEAASGAGAGDDLAKLRAERDDLFERLARATAEFKNSQKRIQTEFDQRVQYANSTLIKSLLPVIDNFERALAQDVSKVDAAAILKGMQIVHDQWLAVLKQQNVEEIAPQKGEPFDPNRHEALMQVDAPEYKDTPTVMQTLQKGYALHGRTLRPAQVSVSRTG
jgi:molecular chaperone GrpE